jgi:hypothetical protein
LLRFAIYDIEKLQHQEVISMSDENTARDKPKQGRPATDTHPLTLRLPVEMINEIDRLRRKEANPLTRQGFIRRHLDDWLRGEG